MNFPNEFDDAAMHERIARRLFDGEVNGRSAAPDPPGKFSDAEYPFGGRPLPQKISVDFVQAHA
jgi:hypothetical protein